MESMFHGSGLGHRFRQALSKVTLGCREARDSHGSCVELLLLLLARLVGDVEQVAKSVNFLLKDPSPWADLKSVERSSSTDQALSVVFAKTAFSAATKMPALQATYVPFLNPRRSPTWLVL